VKRGEWAVPEKINRKPRLREKLSDCTLPIHMVTRFFGGHWGKKFKGQITLQFHFGMGDPSIQ
jgi:hypothetical protein